MYLITAYFDEKSNRSLQRYIDRIAEKTGNRFMTDNHVPPHLTIAAIEAKNPEVLLPAMKVLQGQVKQGSFVLASIGQLLPYVFYGAPQHNKYLRELSWQVYMAVKDIPETSVNRYYLPEDWFPHITLAKKLSKEQMSQALAAMQERFQPEKVQVVELGLSRVNPHEDIVRISL